MFVLSARVVSVRLYLLEVVQEKSFAALFQDLQFVVDVLYSSKLDLN